ncbi:MAG: hypothetical protein LR015_04730 [Verrucomicrobia bacterium]|nr:hypothetical protein [Verrucomicrobiota bacterium]
MLGIALGSLQASTVMHQWLFNEPAGTALLNTVDTVGGAVFNRGINGATTDGEGNLVYASNATWPDITIALVDNPTGIYNVEVEFSRWNVSGYPGTQGPRLMFGFYEDAIVDGYLVGEFELQFFNDAVDFYFADSDEEVLFTDSMPVVLEVPLVIFLSLDKNENTFLLKYTLGSGETAVSAFESGNLSIGSSGRDIGYFGITSNRDFNRANSVPPHINAVTVSFGAVIEDTEPNPEPTPDIWAAGELTESGWRYLPWFGFYVYEGAFVYHAGLGWTYALTTDPDSVFLYVYQDDIWIWTGSVVGTWLWAGEFISWIYMLPGTEPGDVTYFYSTVFGQWFEELIPTL